MTATRQCSSSSTATRQCSSSSTAFRVRQIQQNRHQALSARPSEKRIYARAPRRLGLRNYRTYGQISHSQTACPQRRDDLCSTCARPIYSPTRIGASSPYPATFSTQVRKLVPLLTGDKRPLAVGVTIDNTEEEVETAVHSVTGRYDHRRHNGMGKDRCMGNYPGLVEQWFANNIQTVPARVPRR